MMNILLVSPKRELAKGQPFPPLGLLSIASVLRLHNHSVEILDRDVDSTPFSSIMLRFKPEEVEVGKSGILVIWNLRMPVMN